MVLSRGAFDPQPIIAAILRGETDLFRLLVREYGLFVRGFLAARLHHLEDVDDVAQEVFLVAFDRLKTCNPAHFRQWLVGIAKNELKQHWRKQSRRAAAMERFREELATVVEAEVLVEESVEARAPRSKPYSNVSTETATASSRKMTAVVGTMSGS